jgi:fimbrial isopeptide formation D2 family protein
MHSLIRSFCSMVPGKIAGGHGGHPLGVRDVGGNSAPRRRAGTRAPGVAGYAYKLLLAVLALLFILPLPVAQASVQGDLIVNKANFVEDGVSRVSASVAVTVVIRTSATIEFLKYAQPLADGSLIAGASPVSVAQTAYRTGSAASDSFAMAPAPTPLGSSTPLDLSKPVPLIKGETFHAGEPIFVQVTDPDQNLDRAAAETITITINNKETGHVEVLKLTETGPDTGVFIGYLASAEAGSGSPGSYSGILPVGQSNSVTARYVDTADNSDSTSAATVVDPLGIVFDSKTGKPLDGATVTLFDVTANRPATVYGDDGVAIFPATVITGSVPRDSAGRAYAYPPGGYRFPFIRPGQYELRVTPPQGYVVPTTMPNQAFAQLPGGPFTVGPGSRGERFFVNPGPAIRIDIPADPTSGRLWIQKVAGKSQAAVGDLVPYEIDVQNNDASLATSTVVITDRLPQGFRYRKGSTKIAELRAADPVISADGRTLTYTLTGLTANSTVAIHYVTEVSAGAALGIAVNVASAATGVASSNVASAQVEVRSDFLSSRSLIMGRVFNGSCSDEPSPSDRGIAGVRIFLEDGTFVDTDKNGMYHFEGVTPRAHVVQLDLDSLPEGYTAVSCEENDRFAGRPYSQFVELQGGSMWRADFHLAKATTKAAPGEHGAVAPPPPEPPKKVEAPQEPKPEPTKDTTAVIGIDLKSTLKGEKIVEYQIRLWGGAAKLTAKRLSVTLPSGVVYQRGSGHINSHRVDDPSADGAVVTYTLPDSSSDWSDVVTFRGMLTHHTKGDLLTTAVLNFDSPAGHGATPVAENELARTLFSNRLAMPEVVLHPHFTVLGIDLNADDRATLDDLVRKIQTLDIGPITITGHTDNMPIALRSRKAFADNMALSHARAASVGRYLQQKLHLSPDRFEFAGMGDADPIATNRTAVGRAMNRRVEIRVHSALVTEDEVIELKKGQSGLQQVSVMIPAQRPVQQPAAEPKKDEGEEAAAAPAESNGAEAKEALRQDPQTKNAAPSADAKPKGEIAESEPQGGQPEIKEDAGVLTPGDGSTLLYPVNGVRICLDSALTPRLKVDGNEVPAERIGFTMKDPKTNKTIYSYIGVDFGKAGTHTLLLEGLDPFGNARFKQEVKVTRSGEVAVIRLRSAAGNVADGKTPVKLMLELVDGAGHPIEAAADLEIREGELKPYRKEGTPAEAKNGQYERVHVDSHGTALFQPVSRSGLYRVILGLNGVVMETETYLKPVMRDWILVGIAEGTAGYNTISGHMDTTSGSGIDDKLYNDGRLAFYTKGTIKGEWLMTAAYDSAKHTTGAAGHGLFQTIDPNTYYTLYGDAGNQQYDASSVKKLYLKIERDQFYALFGDYDTALTVTELSRYSRRMNGLKTEMHGKNVDITAFGSETEQSFVKDEIRGDGTSGLYHLSRKGIVVNSDKLTLEIRDRFHSEIIISTRTLNRFTDYSIDYQSGTLLFKEPIYSRDDQFNPIYIIAEYEIDNGGAAGAITAGGRAGVKLYGDRVKAGVTYIHEGQVSGRGDSIGVDTTLKLGEGTILKGEMAHTSTNFGTATSGNAYLAELAERAGKLDSRLYFRELETGFGLGQQRGTEVGTRKFGADATYKLTDTVTLNGQANRDYNLATGAVRTLLESKANYNAGEYGASLGFRHASDDLGDGTSKSSDQLSMGANWLTLNKRLNLKVNRDQSIGSGNNVDYPTRTLLGADYKLTERASVFVQQEFTEGGSNQSNSTRGGFKSTPWNGGTVDSTVERNLSESQDRLFALFGLKQVLKLSDRWTVDGGLDRSQTIKNTYLLNSNVPQASGSEDFTAVSLGADYKQQTWSWNGRFEVRSAKTEDKWGVISALLGEPLPGWGWSARLQLFDTLGSVQDSVHGDLRFGLVYRPLQSRWIILDRLDFLIDKLQGGTATGSDDRRVVNNLNANYRPNKKMQFSLQYGAKYVKETVNEESFSGYTDLIGVEGRYDITPKWDIGVRGSFLHSWSAGQLMSSSGLSVGYNVVENAWMSVGYNFTGFSDKDFSASDYTAQGPFVRFRFKFDQSTVGQAVRWINQ